VGAYLLNGIWGSICSYVTLQAVIYCATSLIMGLAYFSKPQDYDEVCMDYINDNHWFLLFLVPLEEIYRWLFLHIFSTQLVDSQFTFWLLVGVSLVSWWLFYGLIFKVRVFNIVPHFVCGAVYVYIFLKLGLWPTIIIHLLAQSIILAAQKIELPEWRDYYILGYCAIPLLGSYIALRELSPAFNFEQVIYGHVGHLTKWHWLACTCFVFAALKILTIVMCFDTGVVEGKNSSMPNDVQTVFGSIGAALMIIGFLIALFALVDNQYAIAVCTTLFLGLFVPTQSGSGTARKMIFTLPKVFLMLMIFNATNPHVILMCLVIVFLLHIPIFLINLKEV
jgi:hypothetical protein